MMGLYVVSVEARPLPGTDAAVTYAGAFINVYTTGPSESAAREIASREITEAGWSTTLVSKVAFVTREDFCDDSDGLAYFEQALVDGIVVVVHTYSDELDKGDVVH